VFWTDPYASTWFPSKAAPAGAPQGAVTTAAGTGTPPAPKAVAGSPYRVSVSEPGEVFLQPDLSRGLATYVQRSQALAKRVLRKGAADGVLTFAQPVGQVELDRLAAAGVTLVSVEAVGNSPAGRLTVGGPYHRGILKELSAVAEAHGGTDVAVVSAEVRVTLSSYRTAISDAMVYHVDLAKGHFRQHSPAIRDVEMNDLYWVLAGWV
jgi:hypothetical protein